MEQNLSYWQFSPESQYLDRKSAFFSIFDLHFLPLYNITTE